MEQANRQIVLSQLPSGRLTPQDFRLVVAERPKPAEGEALLRTLYVSLDAANRAWMQGATYRSALQPGDVMAGFALSEVVECSDPRLQPGDLVMADTGWREYAVHPARGLSKLPRVEPLSHLLSVYGVAGLTAYFGLLDCGRPREGETVVVSAAAGSVGSLVGQIAKIKGCRTVGIAGGAEKCALLTGELGFDVAIDYKAADVRKALNAACPDGIDVYFDNVGGEVLEGCLANMAVHGRVACCGAISQYDGAAAGPGPRGVPGLVVTKRLTMTGFLVSDFYDRWPAALADLTSWMAQGRLVVREDILHGIEALPGALVGLLAGDNVGKRMVKL